MGDIRDIEKKFAEEFEAIIKPEYLPFYNDIFIEYIIGRDIIVDFDIPKKLKIKEVYQKKQFITKFQEDYYELTDKSVKYYNLKNRMFENYKKNSRVINIYQNYTEFFYNYSLLKSFDSGTTLTYIYISPTFRDSLLKNSINTVKEVCDILNISVKFKKYDTDTLKKNNIDKNITSVNTVIRFVGKIYDINANIFYYYQQKIYELANNIKSQNLIIASQPPSYTPYLTWDLLQNLSQDFEKCKLHSSKYLYFHRRYSIILLNRKQWNNFIIKKPDLYRIYNNNFSKQYKEFIGNIQEQYNNRANIFISLFEIKKINKDNYGMIIKKLEFYKSYTKHTYDMILSK